MRRVGTVGCYKRYRVVCNSLSNAARRARRALLPRLSLFSSDNGVWFFFFFYSCLMLRFSRLRRVATTSDGVRQPNRVH